jgi:hypothetical protein
VIKRATPILLATPPAEAMAGCRAPSYRVVSLGGISTLRQMGCTFCATGTMGLTGDLTAGEIVEQLYHANGVAPIRNVVFM